MVWKDFMGRVLQEGDDVIISLNEKMYTGIIIRMNDDILLVSYNWFKDGREIEEETWYSSPLVPDGVVETLYVLNRK